MLNRGVGVVVALILATTATVAAELTVEQVKAKYAAIFDAPPQKIDGRTYFVMTVKDLPASDVLAGFVNENTELLDYILIHGSGCDNAASTRDCVRKLSRNRSFNAALLPLMARYLDTIGIG